MNTKNFLVSLLAFSVTLLVGHTLFGGAAKPLPTAQPSKAVAPVAPSVAQQISSKPKQAIEDATPAYKRWDAGIGIDRSFKDSGKLLVNKNERMSHELPKSYLDGMKSIVPANFGAWMKWMPTTQEVRANGSYVVLAETGKAQQVQASVKKDQDSQQVVFNDTYKNVDERLYVRHDGGIEHDIILRERPTKMAPDASLAFVGELELSNGITLWDGQQQILGDYNTPHGLELRNVYGNAVMSLRKPYAYDHSVTKPDGTMDYLKQAAPANSQNAVSCQYHITFNKGTLKLAVATPGNWLLDPQREYPVVIDPNNGPNGLADGSPPIYTGDVGNNSGVFPDIVTGTVAPAPVCTPGVATDRCPLYPQFAAWGTLTLPFNFNYYKVLRGPGTCFPFLYVHESGFASFTTPAPFPFVTNACDDPFTLDVPGIAYPSDAFFPYWDQLDFMADPKSGAYWAVNPGTGNGDRVLIIEWYRMGYINSNKQGERISFQLRISECDDSFRYVLMDKNDVDKQNATIGNEGPPAFAGQICIANPPTTDMTGRGIRVCFQAGQNNQPVLSENTEFEFFLSQLGQAQIALDVTQGCLPLTTCFNTTIIQPPLKPCQLLNGPPFAPVFFYNWSFGDGTFAFSPSPCHTFINPGVFPATLTLSNSQKQFATYINTVTVCDTAPVTLSMSPGGGVGPLTSAITVATTIPLKIVGDPTATNPRPVPQQTVNFTGTTGPNFSLVIEQQQPDNFPLGGYSPFLNLTPTAAAPTSNVFFPTPGVYRVTAKTTNAMSPPQGFSLDANGQATGFVNIIDANAKTTNNLILTQSTFHIDWPGKVLAANGVAPHPADDTITGTGYVNLTGLTLSDLIGSEFFLKLNGYNPILDITLDNNLSGTQGDAVTGTTGTVQLQYPSGKFTFTAKGDFGVSFGLTAPTASVHQLMVANYSVQIGGVFNSPGTQVSYDYQSQINKPGSANFTLGKIAKYQRPQGTPGFPTPGGKEVLLSGGFIVVSADLKLTGDVVSATISGYLARTGGDDLRPAATSNVVVGLGNFSETLNFSGTPGFKATGKIPLLKFTYKNSSGTATQSLAWNDIAGNFTFVINNMPNSLVGLNPAAGQQGVPLSFTVTPENGQQFNGVTTFDVFKVSDTEFKH